MLSEPEVGKETKRVKKQQLLAIIHIWALDSITAFTKNIQNI